jgi:formamidopyrimidine-DNA glycosylase
MPELPDVEGFRRYLSRYRTDRPIRSVDVRDADLLRNRSPHSDLIGRRRGRVKALLMKQDVLAGVGNLLADEALWRARIHPGREANRLSRRRMDELHRALQDVIGQSNRRGRIPPDPGWLTGVRDDRKSKCRRCGTGLRWSTISGRTACWCPRCQRR